jgi:hypothetical protein
MTVRATSSDANSGAPTYREATKPAESAQRAEPEVADGAPSHLPAFGSPAFTQWAQLDTVSGHVNNARMLLALLADPRETPHADVPALAQAIERRLAAILELQKRRWLVTSAGMDAQLADPSTDTEDDETGGLVHRSAAPGCRRDDAPSRTPSFVAWVK